MDRNFYELMNTMFQNGWTSGKDLFLGSRDCLAVLRRHTFYIPYPSLSINDTTLEPSCTANLKTCYWNQSADPRLELGDEFEHWEIYYGSHAAEGISLIDLAGSSGHACHATMRGLTSAPGGKRGKTPSS